MAKVNAPLLSMSASGSIGNTLTFFGWKGLNAVRTWVKPANPNSAAQATQRGYMTLTVATIHVAQATATSPIGPLDVAAYALDASTEATPRTWFNQVCAQCVTALKASKQIAVFRGATVTPAASSIVVAMKCFKAMLATGCVLTKVSPLVAAQQLTAAGLLERVALLLVRGTPR